MNVLISCDKFKSSLSAISVCQSIAKGLLQSNSKLTIKLHPMADGGDGTLDVLTNHLALQEVTVHTHDPYNRDITTYYASDGITAYIELASASGIALLHSTEYNPMITSTVGTGQVIKHAIEKGHQHIVLTLGGSCTTDAGLGIAHALGFQFLNSDGDVIVPMGATLHQISKINLPDKACDVSFTLLCDVQNPLYGPQGAAYIFGPQKGATEQDVMDLDAGLKHIATVINQLNGKDIQAIKGGGAAGGIAAGLYGLLDATIISGFDYISEVSGLRKQMAWADLVITGEGQIDDQSFSGKVVGQILDMVLTFHKPILAVVGTSLINKNDPRAAHFTDILHVSDYAKNHEDSMKHAAAYLVQLGSQIDLPQLSSI